MKTILITMAIFLNTTAMAKDAGKEASVNNPAPLFETKTQANTDFAMKNQKGRWTVLYFYPKAETPGCTKQACAFRDNITKITSLGADVYGISTDTVDAQAAFHKKHSLNFTLLADPDAKITTMYGSKMPVMSMSKRWTFIIDPELKIRSINKDVDPVKDAQQVADTLKTLQAK